MAARGDRGLWWAASSAWGRGPQLQVKQNMWVRMECSDGKVEGKPVGGAKEAGGIHVMSHQAVEEFSGDSLQDSKRAGAPKVGIMAFSTHLGGHSPRQLCHCPSLNFCLPSCRPSSIYCQGPPPRL
uniref:Uncharacterized protein n=1 Tax=Rousettus aegyptiacus TaxID=9407 RepID=A0A7J8FJ68_ROUAE|nr:hypothetical protein HJG63_012151 [Rousettus aegyptiacus]